MTTTIMLLGAIFVMLIGASIIDYLMPDAKRQRELRLQSERDDRRPFEADVLYRIAANGRIRR